MRKKLLSILAGIMMIVGTMAPGTAFALNEAGDNNSSSGGGGSCGNVQLFGLDAWYSALDCDGKDISQSNFQGDKLASTILKIVGVIAKDALFLAGFVAVGFVMYGGFLMVTSAGNPGAVEKAKKTISGALIGLVISILAYAIATTVLKLVVEG